MLQQSSCQTLEQAVLPTDTQTFNGVTDKNSSSILIFKAKARSFIYKIQTLIKLLACYLICEKIIGGLKTGEKFNLNVWFLIDGDVLNLQVLFTNFKNDLKKY